jgi:bacterioferritin-associated ferredoxin
MAISKSETAMYVCICHGITERAIREARSRGISSIEQLGAETGCGSTCGSCRPLAAQILVDDDQTSKLMPGRGCAGTHAVHVAA